LLYGALIVGVGAFLFYVAPSIVEQAGRLSKLVPEISERVASGRIAHEVGSQRGWSYETQQRIQQFMVGHRAQIAQWEQQLLGELASLASQAWWLALIPIIAIFFLMSGGRFAETVVEQLTRQRQRVLAQALFQDVHDVLAHYVRAQILLTILALGVYLAGFTLLRLRFAVGLAVVAGLLEFVPMVGPLAGAAIVLATAFFTDYRYLALLVVFLAVWRLVQDYYNSPHIMGGQVQLHPLAVLFGVLAGAEVAGVIGVYLSVPVMAMLRALWVRWREYRGDPLVLAPTEQPPPVAPT
ncbi:MAG: AI-2E family transporter, partial [Terriglobales bacterium]